MKFSPKFLTRILLLAALAAGPRPTSAQAASADPLHSWKGGNDPALFESWINQRLAAAKNLVKVDRRLCRIGPGVNLGERATAVAHRLGGYYATPAIRLGNDRLERADAHPTAMQQLEDPRLFPLH